MLIVFLAVSFFFFLASEPIFAEDADELIIGQTDCPMKLDPVYWGASHTYSVINNMFDTLVKFDEEGEISPNLAVDWEMVEEGRWRFELRDDVVFHNGEKFNSESVKFTIETILDPHDPGEPSASHDMLKPGVLGAEIVDEYTVDIITVEGFGMLLPYLSHDIFMIPANHYEEVGYEEFRSNPVGTGPYEFVSWDIDEEVVLRENENFWNDQPQFEKVIYKVIPEDGTRLSELRTGGINIMSDVPPALINQIEEEDGIRIESVPGYRVMFMKLDYAKTPTDSKYFRKALNYAVDKEGIAESLFAGHAEPISQAALEGFTGYNADISPYPYDPDKAQELLEKADYDGEEVVVEGPSDTFLIPQDILETVAAYLRAVGINARVASYPWGTSLDRLLESEAGQLYYNGYANANYDVETILTRIIHSDAMWSLIDNSELDELIEELNYTPGIEERQEIGAKAMEVMHNDAAWLYLFQQPVLSAVSDGIEFTPHAFESYSARDASRR